MTAIAIIGAGSQLGAAVARRFAREGFNVALISRSQEKLDALAANLRAEGVNARGFAADVRDQTALKGALDGAAQEVGAIEILQYSPLPYREFMRPILEMSAADLVAPVEFSIYGPLTAVQQVLPGMRTLGRGTILFINGGTSVRPRDDFAGTSIGFAGESALGQMLHDALADDGIRVSQLVIPGSIVVGDATNDPTTIAETLWGIHADGDRFRYFTRDMDA